MSKPHMCEHFRAEEFKLEPVEDEILWRLFNENP